VITAPDASVVEVSVPDYSVSSFSSRDISSC